MPIRMDEFEGVEESAQKGTGGGFIKGVRMDSFDPSKKSTESVTNSLTPLSEADRLKALEREQMSQLSQESKDRFKTASTVLEPGLRQQELAGTGAEPRRRRFNPQTGSFESSLPAEMRPDIQSTGQVKAEPSPETDYQNKLTEIRNSGVTGQTLDKAVQGARVVYLQKKQGQAIAPVNQAAEQIFSDQAQKDRKKDYVDEWVRAWDRGSANVASGVLKIAVKGVTPSAQEDVDRYAAAYHAAISSPELAARKDGDWVETGINLVGETLPYMTATTAAHLVAGPAGSFAVGAMVEGNSAYQEARVSGVPEGQARAIGFAVGIASGAIENMGGGGGKYLKALTAKKIQQKLSGKQITKNMLENAIKEALEEGSQEVVSISGERIYKDVNWDEAIERVGKSTVAGFALGGPFSVAGDVVSNLNTKGEKAVSSPAESTSAPVVQAPAIAAVEVAPVSPATVVEAPAAVRMDEFKPTMPIPSDVIRPIQGMGKDITDQVQKAKAPADTGITGELDRIKQDMARKYSADDLSAALGRLKAKESASKAEIQQPTEAQAEIQQPTEAQAEIQQTTEDTMTQTSQTPTTVSDKEEERTSTVDLPDATGAATDNAAAPVLPNTDAYNARLDALDKAEQTDLSALSVGDYIAVPPVPGKSSGVTGFVKKIGPKNVVIESSYGGMGGKDIDLVELSVKKADITKYLKPKFSSSSTVKNKDSGVLQNVDDMESDIPKLSDNVNDVNPIPWSEYLSNPENNITLKEEKNGVKHYTSSNAHYIVYNGRVYTAYGYKGNNLFNQLVENPKQFFDDRREIKASLKPLQQQGVALSNEQRNKARKILSKYYKKKVTDAETDAEILSLRRKEEAGTLDDFQLRLLSELSVGKDAISFSSPSSETGSATAGPVLSSSETQRKVSKALETRIKTATEEALADMENDPGKKAEFYSWSKEEQEARIKGIGDFWIKNYDRVVEMVKNKDAKLVSYLHPGNPFSRKVFTELTNIKLPSTVGGTKDVLTQFVGQEKVDALVAEREAANPKKVPMTKDEAKTKMVEGRIASLLNQTVRFANKMMTRRELMEKAAAEGYVPFEKTVKTEPSKALLDNYRRASLHRGVNHNHPDYQKYLDLKKQVEEGTKKIYRAKRSDGYSIELTKIEYDYFKSLIEAKAPEKKIADTTPTDQLVADREAALAAVREQAKKPVSEQLPDPKLRVVNREDSEENGGEIEKSKGHVAFYTVGKQTYELYKSAKGDLYKAPVSSVMDMDTGNRHGRFEAKAGMADVAAENILNPKPMTPEIKAIPDKPLDPKKFYSYEVVDAENNISDFVEVKATKVILPGFEKIDAFSNKSKDGTWAVTEGKTGLAFGKGKTKKAAYEKAMANLKSVEEGKVTREGKKATIEDILAKGLERTGLSPRYGGSRNRQERGGSDVKGEGPAVPMVKGADGVYREALDTVQETKTEKVEEKAEEETTPTEAEVLQQAKEDAAGQSLADFVTKVETNRNKVMWGGEVLHEYPDGYFPITKDLEKLHSDLRQETAVKGTDKTGDLFAAVSEKKVENTVFTKDAKDAALERQKIKAAKSPRKGKKGGFLEVFDAEDIKDAVIVMGYYAENGIRTAKAFTDKAIEVMGEGIKKHLPEIWNTLKTFGKVTGEFTSDTPPPPTPRMPIPKPATDDPGTKIRGLAASMESSAIDKGIIEEKGGLGALPTYTPRSIQEADDAVADHERRVPGVSKKVAMGEESPAAGLTSADYFRNVRKQAQNTGDSKTLMELLKSPVVELGTEAGQFVQSLDTGERDIDAFKAMKEISDVLETAEQKSQGRVTDKALQDKITALEEQIKRLEEEAFIRAEAAKNDAKALKRAKKESDYGKHNKIIKQERHVENQKRLHSLLSELHAGIDPRIFEIAVEEGLYHLEALSRKGTAVFSDWAASIKADYGDKLDPYLKDIYAASQKQWRDQILTVITEDIKADEPSFSIGSSIQKLAKSFIADGVRDRDRLNRMVLDEVKTVIPDFTLEDTIDAISGYGRWSALSKNEVDNEYRRIKNEDLQLSKLQDIREGKAPKATGRERQELGDEERRLIKLVNEGKKKAGLIVVDAAKQLKTTLATIETRLVNRMKDLRQEIASGQRLIKDKSPSPTNTRIESLRKELEDVQAQHKEIFGRRELTPEQRLAIAESAVQRSIDELSRKIATGDVMPETKIPQTSETLNRLNAVRDTLKQELAMIRESTPEYVAYRAKQSDAAYQKLLTKKLKDLDRQIADGVFGQEKTKKSRELSAESQKLKDTLTARRSLAKAKATLTPEQADRIVALAKDAVEKRAVMENSPRREMNGPDTQEELEYGYAAVRFADYVNELKHRAAKMTKEQFKAAPIRSTLKGILHIANISKALKGAWDISFTFRQGGKTFFTSDIPDLITLLPRYLSGKESTRPRFIASRTYIKALETILGTFNGEDVVAAMKAHQISDPMYDLIKKTKTDISSVEEAHPADMNWVDKIWGVGKIYRASEHAYVLGSHHMRFELAKAYLTVMQESGVDMNSKEELEAVGKMINSLTARGKIGNKNTAPGIINAVLWSPKMLKGNFDVMTAHIFDKTMDGTFARKEAAKNLLKIIVGQALLLALSRAINPDSVEPDPRSSDFGKIRVGDTRFDISGSMDALFTLAVRLSMALAEPLTDVPSFKSSTSKETRFLTKGDYREQGAVSVLMDFLTNKTAPVASVILNHLRGEDRQGNKPSLLGDLRDLFAPMPANTAYELLTNPNAANVFLAMLLDMHGSSTSTYPDSPYTRVKQYIETSAQGLYGKTADTLTTDEYKAITDSQGFKEIEAAYKQDRRQGPATIKMSADLYEAGQRIYQGLPDAAREILYDKGILTIGIGDKVEGMPLNEARLKEYERLVGIEIEKSLGFILRTKNTADDMQKEINRAKDNAREDLVKMINKGEI